MTTNPDDGKPFPDHFDKNFLRSVKRADSHLAIDALFDAVVFGIKPPQAIPQPNTMYYWQKICIDGQAWNKKRLTQPQAQRLVNRVRKLFGRKPDVPVKVEQEVTMDGEKLDGAVTRYDLRTKQQEIFCKDEFSLPSVLIHEATHSLLNDLGEGAGDGHGPQFCAVYLEALHQIKGLDKVEAMAMAKKMDLKIDEELPHEIKIVERAAA